MPRQWSATTADIQTQLPPPPPPPPNMPTDFAGVALDHDSIRYTWNHNGVCDGFRISWKVSGGPDIWTHVEIEDETLRQFDVNFLPPGALIIAHIAAYDDY